MDGSLVCRHRVEIVFYFETRCPHFFFQTWNFRSLEISFPGTFVPQGEINMELSFPHYMIIILYDSNPKRSLQASAGSIQVVTVTSCDALALINEHFVPACLQSSCFDSCSMLGMIVLTYKLSLRYGCKYVRIVTNAWQ